MKVTVYGTGYVGLVTGACLAELGHVVLCMDVDQAKIDQLNAGIVPIWEPDLDELVARNVGEGRLSFTSDAMLAVAHGLAQFIAVGTPPDASGSADLRHVMSVARSIAALMDGYRVIVTKSTVPVGTAHAIKAMVETELAGRDRIVLCDVVSNPEFLKEGAAVRDFLEPDRIIIGTDSTRAREVMTELYEPLNRTVMRTMFMDARSSELTKYAANAMLATKISFINEIANIAERLGADIEEVRKGIAADPRIGHHFISPGVGYGGSCFPKDVQALCQTAREIGYDAPLLRAVEAVNNRQKATSFEKLARHFGGPAALRGRVIAVWGLAFKPNTDDMREAPSRTLIEALWQAGANVQAFDPVAMGEMRRLYGERPQLTLAEDQYAALEGADALVVCTEWPQFRAANLDEIGRRLKGKVLIDGRNIFPRRLPQAGWAYYGVGRPPQESAGATAGPSPSVAAAL